MARPLEVVFSELFDFLRRAGYAWSPLTPEQLLRFRKEPSALGPLERALGAGNFGAELGSALPPSILAEVLELRPAVSLVGNHFVAHSHWPGDPDRYVYAGRESLESIRLLGPKLEHFVGSRVLDLGSGAGALSFYLASLAKEVLGIDSSNEAVLWSTASARAQRIENVRFLRHEIGKEEVPEEIGFEWDFAVFNPPLALPTGNLARPYRDGGALGLEIPLLFLEFAHQRLRAGGQAFCLATNPILQGRAGLLFERIGEIGWEIESKTCLNDRFNQALYRKESYADVGIERVELWFLGLKKKGSKA